MSILVISIRRVWLLFLALSILSTVQAQPALRKFHLDGQAQGTTWSILYYAPDSTISKNAIDSILNELDSSLSIYKNYSTISRFNQSPSGIPIDRHLRKVVIKSLYVSKQTNGLFDITVKPLVEAWGFAAKQQTHMPDSTEIQSLLPCIGTRHLKLDKKFLAKDTPCTQIDVNGIAQGYSVDQLASFLESRGIRNYVAEIGGEIRVKGKHQPGKTPMNIGIEAPVEDLFEPSIMQRVVQIPDGALTTSGSYRKFYESEGKKISHIIDPVTGYSAKTDLIAVTVYAKDAITADGFDNAILMMGLKKGIAFVEKHKDLAAFFIYRDAEGNIQSTSSSRFKRFLTN